MAALKNWFFSRGPEMLANLVFALVILAIGYLVSRVAVKIIQGMLARGKLKNEKMLIRLISKTVRALVLTVVGIIALEKIGVSVAPFVAGLGVSSLVFGFAFKDTLSNFASGLLLIIYRPFQIGDLIDIGGTMGSVEDLSIVNTTLKSMDGPVVYLPNSAVWGAQVTNFTRSTVRRQIFEVGISYGDDVIKAFRVMEGILAGDPRVLKDPSPFVRLSGLGDSSVNFQIFVYTRPDDFGGVLNDFYARLKQGLEAEGLSIPFPQRDLHLIGDFPPAAAG